MSEELLKQRVADLQTFIDTLQKDLEMERNARIEIFNELQQVKQLLSEQQDRNTKLSYQAYPARNASGE